MRQSRFVQAAIARFPIGRFLYGDGPQSAPVTLNRHRIFILPSREGLLFAGALAMMLIGATNYSNSMGFLLTFLLAGLGMVSMLHTYRNMAHLTFRAGYCPPVFAGEQAHYMLLIENPAPEQRFALMLTLDGGLPVHVDVPAQEVTRVVVSRPASQRGYVPMGRCMVSTRFPVGLFRAWAYVDLAMQCLVYPIPALPRALPPLQRSDHARGALQGQGVEDFVGLRQYIQGDSPRHIAWKRAAHEGNLQTKQFAGEAHLQRWLTWDDAGPGDAETRLSVLCRWVLMAEIEDVPYGLRLPGTELPPAGTAAQRSACLRALALYGIE